MGLDLYYPINTGQHQRKIWFEWVNLRLGWKKSIKTGTATSDATVGVVYEAHQHWSFHTCQQSDWRSENIDGQIYRSIFRHWGKWWRNGVHQDRKFMLCNDVKLKVHSWSELVPCIVLHECLMVVNLVHTFVPHVYTYIRLHECVLHVYVHMYTCTVNHVHVCHNVYLYCSLYM